MDVIDGLEKLVKLALLIKLSFCAEMKHCTCKYTILTDRSDSHSTSLGILRLREMSSWYFAASDNVMMAS